MKQPPMSLFACMLLAGAASAGDSQSQAAAVLSGKPAAAEAVKIAAMAAEPDATLDLSGGSVAAGVGYVWGNGDLLYKGKRYQFKVSGVSLVDVGAAHFAASGVVYNLQQVEDFSGGYSAVTAGVTVGEGGSAAMLQNERGVVIKLLSKTQGLRFNFAANGVKVRLNRG